MDFTFTPEQAALREQAREFLGANPEPSWAQLAELGWAGVSIAEEDGGVGLTFVEEAVLFEELGRALYRGPYFSTIALTLPALPDELRAEVASGATSRPPAPRPVHAPRALALARALGSVVRGDRGSPGASRFRRGQVFRRRERRRYL